MNIMEITWLILSCIIAISVLYQTIFWWKKSKFRKVEDQNSENNAFDVITGPFPLPIVGNAASLLFQGPHRMLLDNTLVYGSFFLLWVGTNPFLIVHDKSLVKKIMSTESKSFHKGMFADIMRPLVGIGLLTSEGSTWKLHHKLAQSAFQPSRYKDSLPGLASCILNLMNRWKHQEKRVVDICSEFSRLTLDNIGVAAFGEDFNAVNSDTTCIFDEVSVLLKEMQKRAHQLYPVWKYYPSWMRSSFDSANEKIHEIVREKIRKRRKQLENGSTGNLRYLLDVMIESQETHGLTDEEIEDEMITWVMGGHETTASLLSWTFYLLDKHPDIRQTVKEEIDSVLKLDNGSDIVIPREEDLQQMTYLTKVLKETLRLFPPAPLLNRVAIEDVQLGNFVVPKGTEVLISPWVMHHIEDNWKNPEVFDPERFNGKEDDRFGYSYMPFGAGPRSCLGKLFAFFEAKLVVSMIIQRFSLSIVNKDKVDTEVAITLRAKHGMHCTLEYN